LQTKVCSLQASVEVVDQNARNAISAIDKTSQWTLLLRCSAGGFAAQSGNVTAQTAFGQWLHHIANVIIITDSRCAGMRTFHHGKQLSGT